MRILFEVPLKSSDSNQSQFMWLDVIENWLFAIEDSRRFKTIGTTDKPGVELQSNTLTEGKVCTSLSWNFDFSLLAMIFDKRQIWLWKIKNNNCIQYKTQQSEVSDLEKVNRRIKSKDIDHVEWSRKSNTLIVCYSTGQILLCDFEQESPREMLIDNSSGVLNPVTFVKSSDYLDMFLILTSTSELLIMSYDGGFRFYLPARNCTIIKAKLAPPHTNQRELSKPSEGFTNSEDNLTVWLAYQRNSGALQLKNIKLTERNSLDPASASQDIIHDQDGSDLVDFQWLDSTHLLACYSSGAVFLLGIEQSIQAESCKFNLKVRRLLNISLQLEAREEVDQVQNINTSGETFKAFQLRKSNSSTRSSLDRSRNCLRFSFAAITDYKLFYYEIFADDLETGYSLERVDDLDMTNSLRKLELRLERMKWSHDCSMLAVQLTNSHVLVYRTRLQDYMVASYGSKIVYLSEAKEVTVLNYGCESNQPPVNEREVSDTGAYEDHACIIEVGLKPSIIAIGTRHLAVALNNRVLFYLLDSSRGEQSDPKRNGLLVDEQEYVSIVTGLLLNSHFAAVQFNDGRLKLHAIQHTLFNEERRGTEGEVDEDESFLHERFFPDPVKQERMSSFALTEELFIYCTQECQLIVFSLKNWSIAQTCDHKEFFGDPVTKLKPNDKGNKIICLLGPTARANSDRVYLYDLYHNSMVSFFNSSLYERMFESQLVILMEDLIQLKKPDVCVKPKLNLVSDAIWDTDGRGLLLIENRRIHNCIILDHTLEREETCVEFIATTEKASSYTTLYASHGIVSFQTSLGRVINSILEPNDDELQLTMLKRRIQSAKTDANYKDPLSWAAEVMRLKLGFLRLVRSIHSLQKCSDICEYLMNDEQFNPNQNDPRSAAIESIIWKQLAAWSLYTQDLNFALMLYRKHGLLVNARVLSEILDDARCRSLDSKLSLRDRLLLMLGCDMVGID